MNKKLVHRQYCEEGPRIRRRRLRWRRSVQVRQARPTVSQVNASWSMDFMADRLFTGQRFRLLTFVDNFNRESLAIEVTFSPFPDPGGMLGFWQPDIWRRELVPMAKQHFSEGQIAYALRQAEAGTAAIECSSICSKV